MAGQGAAVKCCHLPMRIPGAAPQPAPPGRNPGFWGARETPTSRRFLHGLKWVVVSPGGSQLGDKAKPHAPSPGTNSIKKKGDVSCILICGGSSDII